MAFCFIDDPYTGDTISGAFGMMLVVSHNNTPDYAYQYASCTRTSPSPTHTYDMPVITLAPDPDVVYYTYYLLQHLSHEGTTLHRLSVTLEDPLGGHIDGDTVSNIGITEPGTPDTDIHALKLLGALTRRTKPYPHELLYGRYVLQTDNPREVDWPAPEANFLVTATSVKPKTDRPRDTTDRVVSDLPVTRTPGDNPTWRFTLPRGTDAGAEHAAHLRIQVTDADPQNTSRSKTVTFGLPVVNKDLALFPVAVPPNGHLPMGYFMLKAPKPAKKDGK